MRAAAGQGRSGDRRESGACSRLGDTRPAPNLFKIDEKSATERATVTFTN